jgi:hypothetical protein
MRNAVDGGVGTTDDVVAASAIDLAELERAAP